MNSNDLVTQYCCPGHKNIPLVHWSEGNAWKVFFRTSTALHHHAQPPKGSATTSNCTCGIEYVWGSLGNGTGKIQNPESNTLKRWHSNRGSHISSARFLVTWFGFRGSSPSWGTASPHVPQLRHRKRALLLLRPGLRPGLFRGGGRVNVKRNWIAIFERLGKYIQHWYLIWGTFHTNKLQYDLKSDYDLINF